MHSVESESVLKTELRSGLHHVIKCLHSDPEAHVTLRRSDRRQLLQDRSEL